MLIDERTLAVVEDLYDAALDDARWPAALSAIADLTGSQAASFWVLDSSQEPRLPTFTYINFDPAFIAEYLADMAAIDPTVRYLVAHPEAPVVHDGLVITEREKECHPYYAWHSAHSDTHFRLVGQARPAPFVQAGVALHRTRKVGRYEPQDIERFAVLYHHLKQALVIGCRLGTMGAMQQCEAELLDRNPAAVLLLDEHKRLVFANRAAQTLQRAPDGIRLHAGGINLPRKEDNDMLQGLINQALSLKIAPAGCAMRALRPSGKRPCGIVVAPISRQYSALSSFRPAVCLIITDPDSRENLPTQCLQDVFGLTAAEARLAALLAEGETLRAAAANLRITYGTARTRLASIFQKTATSRQGELVRVLLTTLAAG